MSSSELVQIRQSSAPKSREGLYIKTYGCQMNEYDSAKLARLLEDRYVLLDSPERAAVVIVNTCSVRDRPEQKLYSMLGELSELKAIHPKLLVGVGGCVAQQEGVNIVKRSKCVDFVFGTHNLSLVPSLIDRRVAGAPPQVAVDYRDEWEELPAGFVGQGRVSVFVSISRGCNKNCTYCIVPTTRGKEVSRSAEEIKKEIRIAVHRGAREVVLLGQTVNSYGLDFSPRRSFAWLIEEISQIPGLERIRFTSPHPQEVRADFIELVAKNPKVCRHIHMPLQSGSDRILKAMNRNYRRKRYLTIIEELRAAVPDIAITTDIIVGFPGETEEDFAETLDIMDRVQFDASFSFMFSPRPGTEAAKMEDSVTPEEKLRRLQLLQLRQTELMNKSLAQWCGREVEVLLDGPSPMHADRLQGRISQNIMVSLNDCHEELVPGMTVKCRVKEVARYTLRGELISVEKGHAAPTLDELPGIEAA